MALLSTQPFLGFRLAHCTAESFVERLLHAAGAAREARSGGGSGGVAGDRAGGAWTVGYLNAATVNLAFERPEFARAMAELDCLYADGMAVVWASRWLGAPIDERVNAGDFTRRVMESLAASGLKLALVGGRAGEAEKAAQVFKSWAPGLTIAIARDGFFTPNEADAALAALEAADPDLILLGMGSPKQETCAGRWSREGRPRVWWCVGALFEYYAGTRRRAPRWMRRAGLEWLFRLALEPRRLWKRYLLGNPLFVWRVLRGRAVRVDPDSRSPKNR